MTYRATVCGFSFGRNLTKLNFPVEAAVRSVLPACDKFVFAVGRGEDDTRERVAAIDPDKITILDTDWPDVKIDGTVLSIEANKAMAAAQETGCTWGFYIQADEVVHEDDLPLCVASMNRWAEDPEVKALLFRYLHFVLDYETTDPWMYHKAARIVRLDRSCEIFGDACGPGLLNETTAANGRRYLDKNHLGGHVRWATDGQNAREARIFHYGWVKSREDLDAKFQNVEKLWWGTLTEEEKQRRKQNKFGDFIARYPALKKFRGTHPALMADRVAKHPPYAKVPNRWLSPDFYREIARHGFHG